ncbi:MAG: hypothetical protein JWP74_2573 [Marmoricola sp.]|nr:hypothetical protein [Marmoricola sp.]
MPIIAAALVLIAVACAAVLNEAGRTLLPAVDRGHALATQDWQEHPLPDL